jgi:hypothetical protein
MMTGSIICEAKTSLYQGTEAGAYVVQWITEEEYERLVGGADVLIRAAANAAIWASEHGNPVTRQRYPDAQKEFVITHIEQETGVRYRWEAVLKSMDAGEKLWLLAYIVGKVKGCSGFCKAPAPPAQA